MLEYLVYLRKHHLGDLAREHLRRSRELDIPLLRHFEHLAEETLIQMTVDSLVTFLDGMAEGRGLETTAAMLHMWESSVTHGVARETIQPVDLVLANASRKNVLLKFIPRFTTDPIRMMALVLELDDYFVQAQAYAFQVFTRVRENEAGRAARAEAELQVAITGRVQELNERLMLQSFEATEANRLKSEFLANMSHELRTPLNSILGYTELVLEGDDAMLDERSRTNLQVVHRNGKHLLELINDVLDLAKVESGKATVDVEVVDPRAILRAVMGTAGSLASKKGLKLSVEIDPALGTVVTDETKVQQILTNLLSNAIKFTGEGQVSVRVAPFGADRWTAEVSDTGVGIAPAHQELIFEEFRQVDASSTRMTGGTGLGLAIARKLARLLGGKLEVTSEPGRGSTFRLELPLETLGVRLPDGLDPDSSDLAESYFPVIDGKLVVLTIDDDPDTLRLIGEQIKGSTFVAVPASSWESGLRLARELKPFAITLDIIMPSKDGWTILRELKGDHATADIPVLILSVVDNKMLGYSLGATGYLTKPVEQTELLAALKRMAGRVPDDGGYVLVIDDDHDTRGLYRELLAKQGTRLVETEDGKEGIQAIEREVPKLVILDLLMPRMDGFEVLAWLRTRDATRNTPVIVVTSRQVDAADRARLSEAQGIFCKSEFTKERLFHELQTFMAGSLGTEGVIHE